MNKHLSIVGFGNNRQENDFYPTPPSTTRSLLLREKFQGDIWECASGKGWMSKVLQDEGYSVLSSDIQTEDWVYGEKGIDFLKTYRNVDNIITNPPYRYAQEFVEHGMECINNKMALLLKLVFLEGIGRYKLFQTSPLKNVYVFCKRQRIYKEGITTKNSGLIAYAWFVWDKSYNGEPIIKWIKD
jgi:hypothetical protein